MRVNSNGRRQVFENVRAIGGTITQSNYFFTVFAPPGMVWAGPQVKVVHVQHMDLPGVRPKRFNKEKAYEFILAVVRQSVRRDR